MANTVIQEWTDEKGWVHRIEIPLMTFLIEHNLEPVVRCKECKWYYQLWIDRGIMREHCQRIRGVVVKADGYCAWGERREDD